ncbi:uncharacterized protein EI97DRAFT_395958 [Westerdykella ornata]|uniref:Cell surface protein n=1 Tax=Westerdykella ornata TaxID=318751 RepID=A0A6A6JLD8_WESOR|nr:uncharacterized protein EI97DRAFT_395958 [Westerdykella ornata]KAF2277317.1 hypothetical protein EI97DRAFT_395958 [Westerdykella ornata]
MEQHSQQSEILLPLYIFPDQGKWDPLYAAIEAHSSLPFTIIINPNSGPGSPPWWPNADYVRELTRLVTYPNVRLLGYVATGYCKRSINDVFADVDAYANWESTIGVRLAGVFFDETPNLWSEEVGEYLSKITERVKKSQGFGEARMVIHNPGTSVDSRVANTGPDAIVVVEESYARFRTEEYQRWLATNPCDREKSSYILHSVPRKEIEGLVMEMKQQAKFLFVTDLTSGFYARFGESWDVFVALMAGGDMGRGVKEAAQDRI